MTFPRNRLEQRHFLIERIGSIIMINSLLHVDEVHILSSGIFI